MRRGQGHIRCRFVVGQGATDSIAEFDDFLGVGDSAVFGLEFSFFAFDEVGRFDFLALKAEEIDFALNLAFVPFQRLALRPERRPFGIKGAVGRGGRTALPEGIEQFQLEVGTQKGLMVMRSVHIDELIPDGFQDLKRSGAAVDEIAAGSGGINNAANDQLAGFARIQTVLLEYRIDPRGTFQREERFGAALILARPDEGFIGPSSQEETQSSDQNGFAGAGFTGDHIQSRFEIDGQVFDQRQIFDTQGLKHGRKDTLLDDGIPADSDRLPLRADQSLLLQFLRFILPYKGINCHPLMTL